MTDVPGSIRLMRILGDVGFPVAHRWCAEYEAYQESGATKEEAVANLRARMRADGLQAPEHVYDLHGTLRAWMN